MTIQTTAQPTRNEVKRYMLNNYRDHVDASDGQLNLTSLVEDAAMRFPTLDSSCEAEVWDWAVEVNERLEQAGRVNPIC